jgi:hypothetical protein
LRFLAAIISSNGGQQPLFDTSAWVVNASGMLNFKTKKTMQWLSSCVLFVGIAFNTIASPSTNSQTSPSNSPEKVEQLQAWLENHSGEDIINALEKFDLNEVAHWVDSQSQTKNQIANLEQQIISDELLLTEKRKTLGDLQSKIDLIKLTPNQIAAVTKYNQSLKQDPYFTEWIAERSTWFEIGKDTVLSAIFFVAGILLESARQKRKHRKLA